MGLKILILFFPFFVIHKRTMPITLIVAAPTLRSSRKKINLKKKKTTYFVVNDKVNIFGV